MAQRLATQSEVEALGAELAVAPLPSLIAIWLPIAAKHVHVQTHGEAASEAHALRTAHYATLASAGPLGITGPLVAEGVGPASRSFGSSSAILTSPLSTTIYGQALEALLATILPPGVVVNGCVRHNGV